jgi:hypothetical protein
MTGTDGAFYLMTTTSRGILPGRYVVTVFKKSEPGPGAMSSEEAEAYFETHGRTPPPVVDTPIRDLLPVKYSRRETSGLSFEITKTTRTVEIELGE